MPEATKPALSEVLRPGRASEDFVLEQTPPARSVEREVVVAFCVGALAWSVAWALGADERRMWFTLVPLAVGLGSHLLLHLVCRARLGAVTEFGVNAHLRQPWWLCVRRAGWVSHREFLGAAADEVVLRWSPGLLECVTPEGALTVALAEEDLERLATRAARALGHARPETVDGALVSRGPKAPALTAPAWRHALWHAEFPDVPGAVLHGCLVLLTGAVGAAVVSAVNPTAGALPYAVGALALVALLIKGVVRPWHFTVRGGYQVESTSAAHQLVDVFFLFFAAALLRGQHLERTVLVAWGVFHVVCSVTLSVLRLRLRSSDE